MELYSPALRSSHPREAQNPQRRTVDYRGDPGGLVRITRNRQQLARQPRRQSLRLGRVPLCAVADLAKPQEDQLAYGDRGHAGAIHHRALRPAYYRRLRHLQLHLNPSPRTARLRRRRRRLPR